MNLNLLDPWQMQFVGHMMTQSAKDVVLEKPTNFLALEHGVVDDSVLDNGATINPNYIGEAIIVMHNGTVWEAKGAGSTIEFKLLNITAEDLQKIYRTHETRVDILKDFLSTEKSRKSPLLLRGETLFLSNGELCSSYESGSRRTYYYLWSGFTAGHLFDDEGLRANHRFYSQWRHVLGLYEEWERLKNFMSQAALSSRMESGQRSNSMSVNLSSVFGGGEELKK